MSQYLLQVVLAMRHHFGLFVSIWLEPVKQPLRKLNQNNLFLQALSSLNRDFLDSKWNHFWFLRAELPGDHWKLDQGLVIAANENEALISKTPMWINSGVISSQPYRMPLASRNSHLSDPSIQRSRSVAKLDSAGRISPLRAWQAQLGERSLANAAQSSTPDQCQRAIRRPLNSPVSCRAWMAKYKEACRRVWEKGAAGGGGFKLVSGVRNWATHCQGCS